jgi:hypothetical protein
MKKPGLRRKNEQTFFVVDDARGREEEDGLGMKLNLLL